MKKIVDILIPYAKQGGPENIINSMGRYFMESNIHLRVVQIVFGRQWADPDIDFYYLYEEGLDQNTESFVNGYEGFLLEHDKPDLIIAAVWPFMSYVAQTVVWRLELKCLVASWLHASVEINRKHGFGDVNSLRYADLHFAISKTIADEIKKDIPDGVIYIVNNPIPGDRINRKVPIRRKLVFIGRLSAVKRVDILIRAVANALANWHLDIYGEGEEKEKLEALVKELNSDSRIEFRGWCNNPWLFSSDAEYLLCASDYESFSLAAIEALANGIPVISTPCDGILEYIEVGKNGFLFPFGDNETLTQILDAISEDKLVRPDSGYCIASAEPYIEDKAFFDFYVKIYAAAVGERLSIRYDGYKSRKECIYSTEDGKKVLNLLGLSV